MKPFLRETMKYGVLAFARARNVLKMWSIIPASGHFKLSPCVMPLNSLVVRFSMEDNLINHIDETPTIMPLGAPMQFYDDPFGKKSWQESFQSS